MPRGGFTPCNLAKCDGADFVDCRLFGGTTPSTGVCNIFVIFSRAEKGSLSTYFVCPRWAKLLTCPESALQNISGRLCVVSKQFVFLSVGVWVISKAPKRKSLSELPPGARPNVMWWVFLTRLNNRLNDVRTNRHLAKVSLLNLLHEFPCQMGPLPEKALCVFGFSKPLPVTTVVGN